jgi:DNA-binding MarR family transcriptional regulator
MQDATSPIMEHTLLAYRQYWTALLQAAEPLWSSLDLTISQLKGLILLEVHDALTIGSVAESLAIGRPSASILVEQLVQLGLARRTEDREDRRRAIVCLTAEGRALAEGLHRGDENFMAKRFVTLSDEELKALTLGLTALTGALLTARGQSEPGSHPPVHVATNAPASSE